jgi:hypothetical protein
MIPRTCPPDEAERTQAASAEYPSHTRVIRRAS